MSKAKVYTSAHPPIPVVRRSIFTYLFEDEWTNEGGSPSSPAYIDAATNQTLTRQDVKTGSLKLAWGLQNRVPLSDSGGPLKRGDTIMIMSPNSLSWPLALFGYVFRSQFV
jgi:4-coumarate--CoA ligase